MNLAFDLTEIKIYLSFSSNLNDLVVMLQEHVEILILEASEVLFWSMIFFLIQKFLQDPQMFFWNENRDFHYF